MDVLTDILDSMRLSGGVVVDGSTRGEWCVISHFNEDDRLRMAPGATELVAYHFVRNGRIHARVDGGEAVTATAGDIILLPRNDAHQLYTRADLPAVDAHELMRHGEVGEPARLTIDGAGDETSFYCGFLAISSDRHPLLDSLPAILKLSVSDTARTEWLESSLRLMNEGTNSPEVLARLAELFLAEAIRRYVEQLPPGEGGWLAGLRDPAVAKALSIIHSRYAEDIDVETLAREAGVSRTILGERFADLIGEPPMRYCARWRMRVAANMLRDGKQNASNVAYSVGFNSEAAFTRAFKREFGVPPATWRRQMEEEAKARGEAQRVGLPQQLVRYATAKDGTRLAFSVMGEGPPLVKAANWLNHLEHDWKSPVWRHWLQELTRDRTLIRYDERANGMSDWDTPEISFEAFVDDLECVIDASGVDRFDLLGISQGASVALAYAVRHPERVRKLVIVGGYATGWAKRGDAEEKAKREAMISLTEIGWGADHPAYRQLFTSLYIPGGTTEQVAWFNEVQRMTASPENAVKLQRALSEIDVHELLEKVTTPTLIFHSRDDRVVPFSAGEFLARGIPGSVFVPIEGENHILLEKEPAWQDFVRVMRDFLRDESETVFAPPLVVSPKDEVRYCEAADGVRIAYTSSGDGFPLVKAPNWITNLETDRSNPSYRHWIAECERNNRFIRSDMRGFGLSDLDPAKFTFDAMVGDVGSVIDDLGLETCDLIGVAHGAPIAIAYAARNPNRVRKLILVNGFAAGWKVRADPEELSWRNSLAEMNQREWSFRRSLLGEMFLTLYFPEASQELIDWHNSHFPEFGPVTRLQEMIDLAAEIDVRSDLPNVVAETLVCHSKRDGNAPLSAGKAVADAIEGSRFVELESSNHILLEHEVAWPALIRELRTFLAAPAMTAAPPIEPTILA